MAWIFGKGLILLMMLFCGPGEAVKCYLCSTKDNDTQCLYPKSYGLPLRKCDSTTLDETGRLAKNIVPVYDKIFAIDMSAMAKHIDLDCLKVETRYGNKLYTFRGCQLAEQESSDICSKMEKANTDHWKTQYCSRCSFDGCNSANKLLKKDFTHLLIIGVLAFMYTSF